MRIESEVLLDLSKRQTESDSVQSKIASPQFDWDHFLRIASRNMIRLFILHSLKSFTIPDPVRHDLAIHLFVIEQHTAARRKLLQAHLLLIGNKLREADLDFVLIKGFSLDHSNLREFGDLDLLIRPDRLAEAVRLLGALGFELESGSPPITDQPLDEEWISSRLGWDNQFLMVNDDVDLLVELHTNLFPRENIFVEDLDQLWQGIDVFWDKSRYDEALGYRVLSSESLVVLMCLHIAIKRSPAQNKFCMRNLIDVDRTCQRGVSWDSIVEDARILGMSAYIYFSLQLSATLMGTDVPAQVLTRLREQCSPIQLKMCELHRLCLVDFDDSAAFPALAYRVACPFIFGKRWKDRIKWALLIPVLFPSRQDIADRFNLQEDSSSLFLYYAVNPFHRLYVAISRLLRG